MKKRPTLREVAQLAGVSKATAARVVSGSSDPIREETRQRVYAAVERLGYERHAIAGSLRSARTYMIALSIHEARSPLPCPCRTNSTTATAAARYADR